MDAPYSSKKDIPITISLVSNSENINHFAFVIILKKTKKIEVMLPVIAEFQILDKDALNFEIFWDPNAIGDKFNPGVLPSSYQIPASIPYR